MKYLLVLVFSLFFGQVSSGYIPIQSKQKISITKCYWEYDKILHQMADAFVELHGYGDPWATFANVGAEVLSETQSTIEMANSMEAVGATPQDIEVALEAIGA